jgi:hypothetical protein
MNLKTTIQKKIINNGPTVFGGQKILKGLCDD